MNAGKSTSLLQSAHNYREQGMEVILYTAALDDRYGVGVVRSRIGLQEEARLFDSTTCLLYTSPSPRDGLLSRMPSSA